MNELLIDSIDKYYSLKNQYQEDFNILKKRILSKSGLSLKEKRLEYQKLKPKCINCKRNVGSLFQMIYNPEKSSKKLIAKCGDTIDPCPLNIEIELGETRNILEIIKNEKQTINNDNNNIIKFKNNSIFGFIEKDDIVDLFEEVISNINNTNLLLVNFEDELYNLENKNNDEIKIVTIKILEDIDYNKKILEDYNKTNNKNLIMDIVSNYKNNILPNLNYLRNLKYAYSNVENEDGIFKLVQEKFKIEDLENYSDNIGVIVFNVGMKKQKTEINKTKKNKKETKQKTKKKTMVIEE